MYHKTLGIPDCVPTPAPEYVLTAVIPRDLFLAPIGTPAGKLNFRGRKKRLFFFAFQFLGMWHYISKILFGCAWKVQIKVFFFCFLDKKMSQENVAQRVSAVISLSKWVLFVFSPSLGLAITAKLGFTGTS